MSVNSNDGSVINGKKELKSCKTDMDTVTIEFTGVNRMIREVFYSCLKVEKQRQKEELC